MELAIIFQTNQIFTITVPLFLLILLPSDFGLLGMAMIVIFMVDVFMTGFRQTLI